jgi:diguanylate cyclase (GGDEF)-like protein
LSDIVVPGFLPDEIIGMTLDYNSLLLALGFSAICLMITLLGTWLTRRTEMFLLTWTLGLVFMVGDIFIYSTYIETPSLALATLAFSLALTGFSLLFGAAFQFRTGRSPLWHVAGTMLAGMGAVMPPMMAGYDGLGFIIFNLAVAIFLGATAYQYWRGRAEARVPLIALTVLYGVVALSFLLCASVLVADGRLVLGAAPQNWAEDLSLAICIAGMTGIGALSLALNQGRIAAAHRLDAMTDPLTGLLNRRALFDQYARRAFGPSMAVIVFDLDRFKSVNDQHGHAAGDIVLKAFAEELRTNLRASDKVARLGGEEFAMVLENILADPAERIAERIRTGFEQRRIAISGQVLSCTTSAGIAFGGIDGTDFDAVLNAADRALYDAKKEGRNRVTVSSHLHAISADVAIARTAS